MTTKDQAIVSHITQEQSLLLSDWAEEKAEEEIGMKGEWHPEQWKVEAHLLCNAAIEWHLAQPPAPDCRTCERRYPEVDGAYGGYTNRCDMKCTNGDQYQPAPKMVLWKVK